MSALPVGIWAPTRKYYPTHECPSRAWGFGLQPSTPFPGLPLIHNPNGISLGSSVFAGLTLVSNRQTDRQTDHATCVTIDRILCYALRCGLFISVVRKI